MSKVTNKLLVVSSDLRSMASVDTYGISAQGKELLIQHHNKLEEISNEYSSRIEELESALGGLVQRYVANLGHTDAEFIVAITPAKHAKSMTYFERSADSVWCLFDAARLALSKGGSGWL